MTNALLGQGAGGASSCFGNAAYGGVDNFSTDAHLLHALVVLNGGCAQTAQQLPDVEYRLVRVLGRVLGLDWSQVNINVFTRNPAATSADYAGLTLMLPWTPANRLIITAPALADGNVGDRRQRSVHFNPRCVVLGVRRSRQLHLCSPTTAARPPRGPRRCRQARQTSARCWRPRPTRRPEIGSGNPLRDHLGHGYFAAFGFCLDCAGRDGGRSTHCPPALQRHTRSRKHGELSGAERLGYTQFIQVHQ